MTCLQRSRGEPRASRLRALARRGETHVVRVEAKSPDTVAEAVFAQRAIRDDRDGADLLTRLDFPDLDLLIDAGGQPAAGGADRDVEDEPGGTGEGAEARGCSGVPEPDLGMDTIVVAQGCAGGHETAAVGEEGQAGQRPAVAAEDEGGLRWRDPRP